MKIQIVAIYGIILCQATIAVESNLRGRRSAKKGDKPKTKKKAKQITPSDLDKCMEVILTGTAPGPVLYKGLAGSGTLVTYGTVGNGCRDTLLQFDVGRSTTTQLSKLDLEPKDIDAVFLTHMHTDHIEDMGTFMFHYWFLGSGFRPVRPPPKDIICTEDVEVGEAYTISCKNYMNAIGDPFIAAGDIAQRNAELGGLLGTQGPAELANVITFGLNNTTPQKVWESSDGNIIVNAITTAHIGGHASYRVDTPVGSVVIAGDASNDEQDPNKRMFSTSTQVESLASNANVIVHTAVHPDFSTVIPPPLYNRQSNAIDVGSMGQRANVDTIMLTHLGPALGSNFLGPFLLPDHPPFTENDFLKAVKNDGGFEGDVVVAGDLSTVRIY